MTHIALRIGAVLSCVVIISGCDDSTSADGNGGDGPTEQVCATMECGSACGEDGSAELYCDLDGQCRDIGEETIYCPVCVDETCGASCQPSCPIGALCGFAGPGFCNTDGECITVDPSITPEPERPFDCPGDDTSDSP